MKADWVEIELGDLVTLNYGKALAKGQRHPGGTVPVYGANGVMDWTDLQLTEGPSLVIGRKGSAGEITRVDGPFWPSDVTYFTEHDQNRINFDFFHYALKRLNLTSMARGVKPGINRNDVYGLTIPLPPLEEQQLIVTILDKAFEGLDRARANAEANLQNVRELFERGVAMALGGSRLKDGPTGADEWPEVELKELVTFHNGDRGKNYPNKSEYVVKGVPWINTGHILPDGSLSESKMNYISRQKFETLRGGKIQTGDLVFCLRGATIGKTAFVAPYENGAVASSLIIIRPTKGISDKYIYYFLTSDLGKAEIGRFIGGAAQPNLAGESVGKFRLQLPPEEEQRAIVEKLDRLKGDCEQLEDGYRLKLQDLSDLKQSLLQKAFAGELT